MNRLFKAWAGIAVAAAALVLAGCDDGGAPAATTSASTTVTGSVVKGPVNGATVTVYALDASGNKGAVVGTATTSNGAYSVTLSGYTGDVLIEVTGGSYLDEATGNTVTLTDTMRVMTTSGSEGGTITGIVTPLTTAAYSLGQVGGTSNVSLANYNRALTSIGTQFNLGSINLVTTLPSVTGTVNAYGQVLRGVSQYVANGNTLGSLLSWSWTSANTFQVAFANAYNTANNTTVTFSFNNNSVYISGTGAGGGSGTCGVHVSGSVTAQSITVPLNMDFCISGIAQGSCTSGNSSISQAIGGNAALSGAANLQYTFGATCAAGATNIVLQ